MTNKILKLCKELNIKVSIINDKHGLIYGVNDAVGYVFNSDNDIFKLIQYSNEKDVNINAGKFRLKYLNKKISIY